VGFALVLAAVSFWPGLPRNPPTPAAADPVSVDSPAPASLIPLDLPVGIYNAT
jgi:hypothetical protein